MIPLKLIYPIPLLAALSACGSTPQTPSQEKPAMTTTGEVDTVEIKEVDTAAPSPALSAEEVGRRFLKLIGGLKSREDITNERVQEVLGITLERTPDERLAYFQNIGGDWFYVISMVPEMPGQKRGVILDFINSVDRFADSTPICGLGFADYHDSLKGMGYIDSPRYDEIGRLIYITYANFTYEEDGFLIGVDPELKVFPDGEVRPACVRRIGI
jgi:hypothetical protein